jgi:hypothetical protein
MNNQNYHDLACAITLQAVREYFYKGKNESPENIKASQKAILKDLRSPYMEFITNGLSVIVAEKLEKNPKEIGKRLKSYDNRVNSERDVAV